MPIALYHWFNVILMFKVSHELSENVISIFQVSQTHIHTHTLTYTHILTYPNPGWPQMAQMASDRPRWLQTALEGPRWPQMPHIAADSLRWLQLAPNGVRWLQNRETILQCGYRVLMRVL